MWLPTQSICLQCGRPGFDPWVRKIPLEKEIATHSITLACEIPWTEEPGGLQSAGSQRVGHDWATSLSLFNVTVMILTKINRDIYINIWLELLDSTLVFILEIGKMWSQSQQFLLLSFLPQMVNRFDCFWRMIGLY